MEPKHLQLDLGVSFPPYPSPVPPRRRADDAEGQAEQAPDDGEDEQAERRVRTPLSDGGAVTP